MTCGKEKVDREGKKKEALFSTVNGLNSSGSHPEPEFFSKGIHTLQEQYQKPFIPFAYFFAQTVIESGYWEGTKFSD